MMKFIKLLVFAFLGLIIFNACEDRKAQEKEQERLERLEAERAAQLKKKGERMTREANSISSRIMDHQSLGTMMMALQNAELDEDLKVKEGPYTVFSPTDDAFQKIEKGNLDTLMHENNREDLTDLLEYHIVEDELTAEDLTQRIEEREGEYNLTTIGGAELTALLSGEQIILKDEKGNTATLVETDIEASNGVIHLIDALVLREEGLE